AARALQVDLQRKVANLEKQQALEQARLEDTKTARATTSTELEQLRQVIAQSSTALEQQAAKAPPSKTLAHRITPIGQVVAGQELHFRLINNRVSVVPLERLIERLKNQIERHKDWLAKSRQQLGQVGPVDGFTMH